MEAQLETKEIKAPLLDQLERNVKRAVSVIADLRAQRDKLERNIRELEARCGELESEMEAQRRDSSAEELKELKAAEKGWQKERNQIADRIDAAVQKLKNIES
jgi:hypothetical protein